MSKSKPERPGTALVTGASSGIGLALAREFAAKGHGLIIVARNRARLAAVAEELRRDFRVSIVEQAIDLSEPGSAEKLWEAVSKSGVEVDILVNNAGMGLYGEFADQAADALTRMQLVNVVALTTLARLALPSMLRRKRGRILNVASVVGYQPGGPRMSVYYATKSYVLSFSRGLARELDRSGVTVTALSPGVTQSSFEESAGAGRTILYRRVPKTTAQAVAKSGYRATMHGRRGALPGFVTKLLAFAGELPPRRIALAVNGWLLKS